MIDIGYTNCEGFLAPYRGQRYHLNEWHDGHQPENAREFYNMKHASARNTIERCFGMIKQRWAILRSPSFYPVATQRRTITTCCLLHNFLMQERENAPLDDAPVVLHGETISSIETSDQWTNWRDQLAQKMYDEWRARGQGTSNNN